MSSKSPEPLGAPLPRRVGYSCARSAKGNLSGFVLAVSLLLLQGLFLFSSDGQANDEVSPIWGEVLLLTGRESFVGATPENERLLTTAFVPREDVAASLSARDALLRTDSVVLVGVISEADDLRQQIDVPFLNGEVHSITLEDLLFGGTVVAFSPLTRTVLATVPVLARKSYQLRGGTSDTGAADDLNSLLTLVGNRFQERARSIATRAVTASVTRGTFGSLTIQAGTTSGLASGVLVAVGTSDGSPGAECLAGTVEDATAELKCTSVIQAAATGTFLRSTGVGTTRYQVQKVSITSPKALESLNDVHADESRLALVAGDALGEHGLTCLPSGGAEGERVIESGIHKFVARHGIADTELDKFTLHFPPPEVQLRVLIDGFNTTLTNDGVEQNRVYKAWATITDQNGRKVDGVAFSRDQQIAEWSHDVIQAAFVREALSKAVRCAVSLYLGKDSNECV